MPRKGRPRLVSSKASGTKLFVDDLREVIKLAQAEGRGTISDVIRDLVHEALAYRRLRAMGRDAAEEPLRRIHPLLTDLIGFAMTAEMKTHLLLQNFLLSRGLSEEAARKLIAEHEEKSRQNTEKIVVGLMQSQS